MLRNKFKADLKTQSFYCATASTCCCCTFTETETLASSLKLSVTGEELALNRESILKGTFSRQYAFAKPNQQKLTLDYCSIELKVTAAYAVAVAGTIGFGLTGLLIFLPNAFQLPMKFYIFSCRLTALR